MNSHFDEPSDEWRVLLVDDQPAFRHTVASLFAGQARIDLAGAVGSDSEARDWVERRPPDALLIDVNVPEHGGFALARTLAERGNKAAVIMISASEQSVYRQLANRVGALAFVEKGMLTAERVLALLDSGAATRRMDRDG